VPSAVQNIFFFIFCPCLPVSPSVANLSFLFVPIRVIRGLIHKKVACCCAYSRQPDLTHNALTEISRNRNIIHICQTVKSPMKHFTNNGNRNPSV